MPGSSAAEQSRPGCRLRPKALRARGWAAALVPALQSRELQGAVQRLRLPWLRPGGLPAVTAGISKASRGGSGASLLATQADSERPHVGHACEQTTRTASDRNSSTATEGTLNGVALSLSAEGPGKGSLRRWHPSWDLRTVVAGRAVFIARAAGEPQWRGKWPEMSQTGQQRPHKDLQMHTFLLHAI